MTMSPYDDDSLGLSVLLYVAALLGVLAVVVVPVYLANKSTVQKNPGITAAAGFEPSRPRVFPLSHLKAPQIVDPAVVAKLNAEAAKQNDQVAPIDFAAAPDVTPPTGSVGGYAATGHAGVGGPSSLQYNPAMH
jgi:hypothetical protein